MGNWRKKASIYKQKGPRKARNQPDLYCLSHRPDTAAQNRATGKNLHLLYLYFLKGVEKGLAKQDQVCYVEMQFVQQIRSSIGTTSCILSTNKVNMKFTSRIQRAHFTQLRISVVQKLVTPPDGTTPTARLAPLPSSPLLALSQRPSPKVFTNYKELIPMPPVQAGKFNPFYGWTRKNN